MVKRTSWGASVRLRLVIWLMLSLVAQTAHLEERINLYSIRLPISDYSETSREAAFRDGLEALMIRVTGKRYLDISEHTSLKPQAILGFVQQYRYHADEADTQPKEIELLYDKASVNKLLQKAQLPIWNEERPSLLMWLVVQQGGERRLVTDSELTPWLETLRTQANLRGLPIILPLGDISDAQNVDVSDLWGGFHQKVINASTRYQADMVLVGKLRDEGGVWASDWSLFSDYPRLDWQLTSRTQGSLMQELVDALLEPVGQRYVMPTNKSGRAEVLLEVSGVVTLPQVNYLMNQLNALSPVTQASLYKARPDSIQFRLVVDGNKTTLLRAIEKLSKIESASHVQTIDSEVDLHYRWVASKTHQ